MDVDGGGAENGNEDGNGDPRLRIRRATPDDYDDVVEMVSDIWADRGGDYLPDVYHDWLEDEGEEGKKTFVAEIVDDGGGDGAGGDGGESDEHGEDEGENETAAATNADLAGIVQAVMLSEDEAWFQSMRVNSDYRRMGVSQRLNEACFEWARERGATVGRVMIFSWNAPSLAAARTGGFRPVTEFRWARPEPDSDSVAEANADANADSSTADEYAISSDPTVAWRYWTDSAAREHLRGLALSPEETWALRELAPDDLAELPVFAVTNDDGACAMAYRTRTFGRTTDEGEQRTWAEYGVAAWEDVDAVRVLFAAIARDAAEIGADETRVCVPETAETVSDAAYAGAGISEEPDFVLEIDLC